MVAEQKQDIPDSNIENQTVSDSFQEVSDTNIENNEGATMKDENQNVSDSYSGETADLDNKNK